MTSKEHQDASPRLTGCAARLVSIEPDTASAAKAVGTLIQADPRLEESVLRITARAGGSASTKSIEQAIAALGVPTVRALGIALDLCAAESATDAARWAPPAALAISARALSQRLGAGTTTRAFVGGLLCSFGPATLERWRLPPSIVKAVARRTGASAALEQGEDESCVLGRVLGQAELLADTLISDPSQGAIDWARASSGLEVLREILEMDRGAFAALFLEIGREWADWVAALGAPRPPVLTLEDVQRRAGEVPADDAVVRALESGSTASLRGLRILAVDDEPVSLKVLERALRKAGHDVVTAVNGSEALRVALEMHPHAVIADWMMPELDGIDLCRALRRSELGRSVFFLLLTGRGEEDRIVEAFDAGVDDYVTKPFNPKILLARLKGGQRVIELQERVEANRRVVMKQVAEMGLLTRKLRNAAHTDALTDLPNRRYAMARLESEWESSGPTSGRSLSAVLIDIDHFKSVNDTYGHDVGDLVLKEVAVVLRANTRQGEEVSRLGGEEFFVVCANTNEDQARIAGERLRSAIERHVIQGLGFQGGVTISVGVAQRVPGMPNQDALIKAADHAVYAAKSAGRNRVVAISDLGAIAQSA